MAKRRRLATAATRATLPGLAWGVMVLSASSQSPLARVETRDAAYVGELLALDSAEGVQLLGEEPIGLPITDVLNLLFEPTSSRVPSSQGVHGEVTLIDGTRLAYRSCEQRDGALLLQLTDRSHGEVRLAGVQRWWLDSQEPPANSDQRVADVLWVKPRQGEGVTPVEGVVLDVGAEGVRFAFSAEETTEPVVAPWSRLAGVEFYHETTTHSTPECVVTLATGGRVAAEKLLIHAGRLAWASDHGRGEIDLREVRSIDLSAGRVTPVSGLKLLEQSWRPYYEVGTKGAGLALDASLDGAAIQLREPDPRAPQAWPAVSRDVTYERGVALKSRGEARFALPKSAARLKGRIGLDPGCVSSGSAEVAILADERVVWSGVVDGTTEPAALNAPLEEAATLTLRVDFGDNLDAGDHVHFADLRVIQ